ncbi:Uu.00g040940.m01.CDS01 [Anthostomella pinea]|uniref:Uu.00g040940.m01.CDS01 n=1 Tax=Anthostomella pinea TaxID=933095 RepID=A0AAI8YDW2_9PEZI|nr:Uu.00g040940.m01.CDS01 [Anthostomella pinea]
MDPSYAMPGHDESLQGTPLTDTPLHPSPYPRQQPQIPLVCSICPKNSSFSDISHLLTHVSSKGHLHNYFQLSISRDIDEDAAFSLTEFDTWFEEHNINALLRVRKTARDQRGTRQHTRGQTPTTYRGSESSTRRGNRGGRNNRGGRAQAVSPPPLHLFRSISYRANKPLTLDLPQRSRGLISREPDPEEVDEIKDESEDDNDMDYGHSYSVGQASYPWQTFDGVMSADQQIGYVGSGAGHFEGGYVDDDDSSKYGRSEGISPFPSEDTVEPDIVDETGTLVLKGLVLPGMAGFDAATREARKQRNQRKHPVVLQRLKICSEQIDKREEVLNRNFELQRVRDVYDEPSIDGSADEDEVKIKKSTRRGRKAPKSAKKPRADTTSHRATRTNTRAPRASARATRHTAQPSARTHVPSGRVTRSAANRQAQMPIHAHGLLSETDIFDATGLNGDDGWLSQDDLANDPWLTSNLQDSSNLLMDVEDDGSLALRPGNPNLAFASPMSGLRKASPAQYTGKENSHHVLKSPSSSSNPYLQTAGDPVDNNNYNPLYVQPRDSLGFRVYSPYDEEAKPSTTGSFHPINTHTGFDSLHMPGQNNGPYHRSRTGGDDYNI